MSGNHLKFLFILFAVLWVSRDVSLARGNAIPSDMYEIFHLCSLPQTSVKDGELIEMIETTHAGDLNHLIPEYFGQSILFPCSRQRRLILADYLLAHGIRVSQQDEFGYTPLMIASEKNYPQLALKFLNHSDSIQNQVDDENHNALWYASYQRHKDMIKILVHVGSEIRSVVRDPDLDPEIKDLVYAQRDLFLGLKITESLRKYRIFTAAWQCFHLALFRTGLLY